MKVSGLDAALVSIEESIVMIVREVTLPRLQERVTADAGVSIERAGYSVLRALEDGGPTPVSTLARQLGLDTSTVSRHVAALESNGMLSRAEDPTDRRVALVGPTREGRRALGQLRAARHRVFADMLSHWPPDDRETLAPLLARLASEFATYGGRSRPRQRPGRRS